MARSFVYATLTRFGIFSDRTTPRRREKGKGGWCWGGDAYLVIHRFWVFDLAAAGFLHDRTSAMDDTTT